MISDEACDADLYIAIADFVDPEDKEKIVESLEATARY